MTIRKWLKNDKWLKINYDFGKYWEITDNWNTQKI